MKTSVALALDMLGKFDAEKTSAAAGSAFFDAIRPLGVRALFARSFPSRAVHIPTETLAKQQHVYTRISPDGWEDAYARARLERDSPLIRGVQTQASSFVWSEAFPDSSRSPWQGWKVLSDFDLEDGIGVPVHGPGGYCAVVSLGFERIDLSPQERRALDLASIALHDHMRALSPLPAPSFTQLSERERDALAFVAEGKSDWEIGVILNIAQATAHSHVENAKRKMGARSRAQAVARAVRMGLI